MAGGSDKGARKVSNSGPPATSLSPCTVLSSYIFLVRECPPSMLLVSVQAVAAWLVTEGFASLTGAPENTSNFRMQNSEDTLLCIQGARLGCAEVVKVTLPAIPVEGFRLSRASALCAAFLPYSPARCSETWRAPPLRTW